MMQNIDNPKFARAVACFRLAFLARQRLYYACERGRKLYGVAGNLISGGFYSHWPNDVKKRVRRLNHASNRLDDAAFGARPKRVQMHTMLALRQEVIIRELRKLKLKEDV